MELAKGMMGELELTLIVPLLILAYLWGCGRGLILPFRCWIKEFRSEAAEVQLVLTPGRFD